MIELKFDSFQWFQLDAIAGVVNLFNEQPMNKSDFTIEIELGQNAVF